MDRILKIVLVGDASVGKTTLAHRYVYGTSEPIPCSVSLDFLVKTVEKDGKKIKLQIWDTTGQERYKSSIHFRYRGANVVVLMFDIHVRVSFERLNGWLREIDEYCDDSVVLVIVGNKLDLEDSRTVSVAEGKNIARKQNVQYFEVSAKEGTHLEELFDCVISPPVVFDSIQSDINSGCIIS